MLADFPSVRSPELLDHRDQTDVRVADKPADICGYLLGMGPLPWPFRAAVATNLKI
jgi:hypothetical protein